MGLNLGQGQVLHQTKGYALQNKEMHVNKPLSINLAIIPEKIFGMTFFSVFPSKKVARRARSSLRAIFLSSYAPQRATSLIIHELQHQKDAKFFTFFPFLLAFGGWDCNHFAQNFTENNSIENFKAPKSREIAENFF